MRHLSGETWPMAKTKDGSMTIRIPFADSTVSEQPADAAESEHIDEPKADDSPVGEPAESLSEDEVDLSEDESTQAPIAWGLPIRAAPLLEENGEIVVEYPLKQSLNGRETTSIVVDEDLLRVVDTELGVDNHRRIKVKLTVKRDITGFSHQHNELMHQHQFLWIGCFIAGLCLSFVGNIAFGVLGALLMIIGVRSWVLMHLETHTLTFSSNGGSHQLVLRAYGTNRGFFRASMALIGPVMAGFIRNGEMETKELEQLHSSLLTPTPPVEPSSQFPTILHRTFPQAVQPCATRGNRHPINTIGSSIRSSASGWAAERTGNGSSHPDSFAARWSADGQDSASTRKPSACSSTRGPSIVATNRPRWATCGNVTAAPFSNHPPPPSTPPAANASAASDWNCTASTSGRTPPPT
jgi:hypothetical protein